MTLPTTILNATDDDSDMFGPPRTSPLRYTRPRVPMISAKLRLREERKRILQLCAHKLERIKDSETNLRRSVCINNTYSRLTDEVRREKQSRYLANLPKSEITNTQNDDFFSSYGANDESLLLDNQQNDLLQSNQPFAHHHNLMHPMSQSMQHSRNDDENGLFLVCRAGTSTSSSSSSSIQSSSSLSSMASLSLLSLSSSSSSSPLLSSPSSCMHRSSNMDSDLESVDREINALDASMPLVDPEITQGAEQLEKAISRKRSRSEEDNDRLVREALSHIYLPSPRLLSGIDDCPLLAAPDSKRCKTTSYMHIDSINNSSSNTTTTTTTTTNTTTTNNNINNNNLITSNDHLLDFEFDHNHNQNQKEFEVIMDALRLGGTSQSNVSTNDSCGQAAMMSENGVFHNLVVASLET